jgi:cytochrome c-type biogenesis protein CcsB
MKTTPAILLALLLGVWTPLQAGVETARRGTPDLSPLETLPIQDRGRVKPFRVFAIESMQVVHGRARLKLEDGVKLDALPVVVSMWFDPQGWEKEPVVLVDHLGLKQRFGLDVKKKFFPLDQLLSNRELSAYIAEVNEAKRKNSQLKLDAEQTAARQLGNRIVTLQRLLDGSAYTIHPLPGIHDWVTVPEAFARGATRMTGDAVPPIRTLAGMREAYLADDSEAFHAGLAVLAPALRSADPGAFPPDWKIKLEDIYNERHPFRTAWILALIGLIILASTSIWKREAGYRWAWAFILASFVFQVAGFVARILIAGRPPVTNMYETVIWLSFGTLLFALVFEAIHRCRYFLLGAAPVSVVALILADNAPVILDPSIQPLTAVLNSNFWLTTHVLTITLSYAAFALALGVGNIILGKIAFGSASSQPTPQLYNYLYRSLQIGFLLIAIGTILGGVWANYSWGRFWGWDPKETWALIALLCYAVVLHGRIAGYWGGLGLAVGSVVCFQAIIMAWYGVNFILGVGLHSYGFGTGGRGFVVTYLLLQTAFLVLALARHWRRKAAVAA